MSTKKLDVTASPDGMRPTHLTTQPNSRIAPDLEVDPARGLFYCVECNRRVTRNTENGKEYGHDRYCEYHETSGIEPIETGHFADGGAGV